MSLTADKTSFATKRIAVSGVLLAIIAILFWTNSRYPALGEKAIMGGGIKLEDPLSFEAFLPVLANSPIWQKVLTTTINWVMTNLQGMTFGVVFGAAFLTFLKYLPKRHFNNGYGNSLLGFFIGAPLGVCVNCAAPVARGLFIAGTRLETALSAMIASPTYNVVVISLMLGLLPFYLVVAKLILSLFIILVAVPAICRFLPKEQLHYDMSGAGIDACEIKPKANKDAASVNEPASQAIKATLSQFIGNLWFIARTTIPLMIVAGFLGALVATFVPLEMLKTYEVGLLTLIAAACIGLFLPAPIAFDVVLAAALLGAGVPIGFVMVLLFTLGIFSVYSFIIVTQTMSLRVASLLSATILVVAVLAGFSASAYNKWNTEKALELLKSGIDFNLISSAHAAQTENKQFTDSAGHKVEVSFHQNASKSPADAKLFSRIEAHNIGIDRPITFTFNDYWAPFWMTNGSVSLADIDNDGDLDGVFGNTNGGVLIFLNNGKGQFSQRKDAAPQLKEFPVFNIAPVDVNNDGWLDLFATTYNKGNFVLLNKNGSFKGSKLQTVANRQDAIISFASSFADIDLDGDLDVVMGNWSAGWYRRVPGEASRNAITLNNGKGYTGQKSNDLPGMPGETLSILFSDYNKDGKPDLLIGNDFEQPDVFYHGNGNGTFKRIKPDDKIIPHSTTTTMAVKTADLDNDLKFELYMAQIAGRAEGLDKRLKLEERGKYCDTFKRLSDRKKCQINNDIRGWYKPGNNLDPALAVNCLKLKGDNIEFCKAQMIKDLAIQNKNLQVCNYIKPRFKRIIGFCKIHFRPVNYFTKNDYKANIPSVLGRNVLLTRNEKGSYQDQSKKRGLDVGGWSWDVKIFDFDHDGWQDVFIVNGWWPRRDFSPTNIFFHNKGDGTFKTATEKFGMVDHLDTPGVAAGDIDNDGDIDMITSPINGPVIAYINNSQSKNTIQFDFSDEIGNRFGVGNKIIIEHGKKGKKKQIREIKLGGGFTSFEYPRAHFGLGEHQSVKAIEIFWSTGEKSRLEGPFKVNGRYVIKRTRK